MCRIKVNESLDDLCCTREIGPMQHKSSLFAAASVAAFLSLAACDNQPETLSAPGGADPQAEQLAKAKPVELPPAISASRTYRCKDNSLVYIDFFSNNSANVRLGSKEEMPTQVKAADANSPMTAEGYSVSGNTPTITLTAPGKGTQSCKA